MARARIAAIACLAVGVALLAVALFGHGWGALDGGRGHVGLHDTICADALPCPSGPHGATPATANEHEQFARFGQLALLCGALAGLAGVAAACHARIARALAMPATVLAAAAAGSATAFVALQPFFTYAVVRWQTGVAWSELTAGAALVACGVRVGAAAAATARSWPAAAALAGAVALAVVAHGAPWWRGTSGDVAIAASPAMVELCGADPCREVRFIDLPATTVVPLAAPQARLMGAVVGGVFDDRGFAYPMIVAGIVVEIAAAVAAVLAAALAAAALARRRARALASIVLGAVAALVAAVAVLESYRPGAALARYVDVSTSYGLPLAAAGALLAIAAALPLARGAPAPATAAPAELPVPGEIPTCASCALPMLWVGKRRIWLCTRCKARDSVTP